jgi:hypothetical protein
VRNCIIRLLGDDFNYFIIGLSKNDDFLECIEPLSEGGRRKMGNVEIVLRFFAFKNNFDEFRHSDLISWMVLWNGLAILIMKIKSYSIAMWNEGFLRRHLYC